MPRPKTVSEWSIPTTTDVLSYLIHVFGVPAKASGIDHKDLQRIGTGSQSQSKHERLVREIVDVIAAVDGLGSGTNVLKQIEQRFPHPDSAQHWYADGRGKVIFDRVLVVRDLVEFLQRNEMLREGFGRSFTGNDALVVWLADFAIPFVAANLVDYSVAEVDWDAGMPGGRHWFIPQFAVEKGAVSAHRMPTALIMRWWQDALGVQLTSLAATLLPNQAPDSARRAIERWLSGGVPPGFAKIEQWSTMTWDYQGTFTDEPAKSLLNRWVACRAFLARKGMIADASWKERGLELPSERRMRQTSDGHPLELEIPQIDDLPFARFFESADPIAEGLPVEELIQRVARRWTAPTASQLRLRLMIGCAMHRACRDLIRATDTKSCFVLTQWFCEAYNVLLQHHLVARDPDSITRLIGRHYVEQPERADALRWLYSLEQWQQLPRRMFDQLG